MNNKPINRNPKELLSEMEYKNSLHAKVCYNCVYFIFEDGGDRYGASEECHYPRKMNIGVVLNVSSYGSCKYFTKS